MKSEKMSADPTGNPEVAVRFGEVCERIQSHAYPLTFATSMPAACTNVSMIVNSELRSRVSKGRSDSSEILHWNSVRAEVRTTGWVLAVAAPTPLRERAITSLKPFLRHRSERVGP